MCLGYIKEADKRDPESGLPVDRQDEWEKLPWKRIYKIDDIPRRLDSVINAEGERRCRVWDRRKRSLIFVRNCTTCAIVIY